MYRKESKRDIFIYFLILFSISIFFLYKLVSPFLNIIVLSLIISALFYPLYMRMIYLKFPRVVASTLSCFLIFIIIFIPVIFITTSLSNQAYNLYLNSKSFLTPDQINDLVSKDGSVLNSLRTIILEIGIPVNIEDISAMIQQAGKQTGLFFYDQLRNVASNIIEFLLNSLFLLFICYFLFLDGDKLFRFTLELSPLPDNQEEQILNKFKDISYIIIIINGISGLIQGILGGFIFYIFDIPSYALWGFIMVILAFLPIIGISIIYIPVSMYLFITAQIIQGIIMLVIFSILTGLIEYVIKPILVGSRSSIHPLLVFISIIGGLKLFGITGILYGPIIVSVFLVFTELYKLYYEKYLAK